MISIGPPAADLPDVAAARKGRLESEAPSCESMASDFGKHDPPGADGCDIRTEGGQALCDQIGIHKSWTVGLLPFAPAQEDSGRTGHPATSRSLLVLFRSTDALSAPLAAVDVFCQEVPGPEKKHGRTNDRTGQTGYSDRSPRPSTPEPGFRAPAPRRGRRRIPTPTRAGSGAEDRFSLLVGIPRSETRRTGGNDAATQWPRQPRHRDRSGSLSVGGQAPVPTPPCGFKSRAVHSTPSSRDPTITPHPATEVAQCTASQSDPCSITPSQQTFPPSSPPPSPSAPRPAPPPRPNPTPPSSTKPVDAGAAGRVREIGGGW